MQCDICGKNTELFSILIEGSELNVCTKCSNHGKILPKKKLPIKIKQSHIVNNSPKFYLAVVKDYAQRIKQKRESLGLKQEEFAQRLNEKCSIIQKIESNHFQPDFQLARKLEHFLKIKLVEQKQEENFKLKKNSSNTLTIGDLIKIKKR